MRSRSRVTPGFVTFPPPLNRIIEPVLAEAAGRGELRAEDTDAVVQRVKEWKEEEVRGLVEAAERSCGDAAANARDILDREQVLRMAASGLVRFGSHMATHSHSRLGRQVSAQELEREIVGSRKDLQDLSGQAIDLFCYPNAEASPEAVDLVRRNYLGAVTTCKAWHAAGGDSHLIRRIGVHEDVSSAGDAFLERVSAWL